MLFFQTPSLQFCQGFLPFVTSPRPRLCPILAQHLVSGGPWARQLPLGLREEADPTFFALPRPGDLPGDRQEPARGACVRKGPPGARPGGGPALGARGGGPGEFWYRFRVKRTQYHIEALVDHRNDQVAVSASVSEWAIQKHPYCTKNVVVCERIGLLLAERC